VATTGFTGKAGQVRAYYEAPNALITFRLFLCGFDRRVKNPTVEIERQEK
jgi:hypothetical protein